MTDDKRGTGFWAAVALCGIVAIPILYLLSFPAFVYMSMKHAIPDAVLDGIAWPLAYWHDTFGFRPRWFWIVYGEYTGLWGFPI